jgi:hypothetical protein
MEKPAKKEVDDRLFAGAGSDIRRLNKQARKELRVRARAAWKRAHTLNPPND